MRSGRHALARKPWSHWRGLQLEVPAKHFILTIKYIIGRNVLLETTLLHEIQFDFYPTTMCPKSMGDNSIHYFRETSASSYK